jgi:hypothetical protein
MDVFCEFNANRAGMEPQLVNSASPPGQHLHKNPSRSAAFAWTARRAADKSQVVNISLRPQQHFRQDPARRDTVP